MQRRFSLDEAPPEGLLSASPRATSALSASLSALGLGRGFVDAGPSRESADVAAVAEAIEAAEERLAGAKEEQDGREKEAEDEIAGAAAAAHKSGNWAAFARAVRRHAPDATAASLLRSELFTSGDFISGQLHENDKAEVCLVCEPDLHNQLMGALHPAGSLYERPVNVRECTAQHSAFRAALRANGVKVLTVREVLLHDTDTSVRARVELEDLAAGRLRYELDDKCEAALISPEDRFFVGDQYKRTVLEAMSAEQLIDVVLCGPTVHVMPSFRDTGFTARYVFEPLTNVQFTRDQQVTTARGIVAARLRSAQRQSEVALMRFCFDKLGLPVVGAIREPGFLEGGDFFPAGRGLALCGVGLRSNLAACEQLMRDDLLGTTRLAVVRDDEVCQDRMHLDCVFNIISDDVCLLAEDIIGAASPLRRSVDVYEKVPPPPPPAPGAPTAPPPPPPPPPDTGCGSYVLRRSDVEFSTFLKEEGFTLIPIGRADQLKYACNVLNLGDSTVLSCHAETARLLVRCPQFHGSVQLLDFGAVTSMYGALHCSSQIVRRAPQEDER